MAAVTLGRPAPPTRRAPSLPSRRAAIGWLLSGAGVLFLTSLVAGDLVGLHHDLYLLVYVTAALGYIGSGGLPIHFLFRWDGQWLHVRADGADVPDPDGPEAPVLFEGNDVDTRLLRSLRPRR